MTRIGKRRKGKSSNWVKAKAATKVTAIATLPTETSTTQTLSIETSAKVAETVVAGTTIAAMAAAVVPIVGTTLEGSSSSATAKRTPQILKSVLNTVKTIITTQNGRKVTTATQTLSSTPIKSTDFNNKQVSIRQTPPLTTQQS